MTFSGQKTSRAGVFIVFALSLLVTIPASGQQTPLRLRSTDAIGITVSDMDRAVAFYSKVLTFEKVSDIEVSNDDYEHLEGVFGLRMRLVRMR